MPGGGNTMARFPLRDGADECGADVVAADFSPAMVAEARRRQPRLAVQEAEAELLPFAKGAFDAVVMNVGVLHLGQLEQALAEAYRLSYRQSSISRWLMAGYSFFRLPTSDSR